MARVVVASIANATGERCVDIFRRDDGSYGFGEWRRDVEDLRWHAIGGGTDEAFDSEAAARNAACRHVAWFGGRDS